MKLEGWHIVIIIVLAIVLFGAPKLPGLARSVGQSLRIFKSEVKQMKDENNAGIPGTEPVHHQVHQVPPYAADAAVNDPADGLGQAKPPQPGTR